MANADFSYGTISLDPGACYVQIVCFATEPVTVIEGTFISFPIPKIILVLFEVFVP